MTAPDDHTAQPASSDEAKDQLRDRIKQALAEMTTEEQHDASLAACARLVGLDAFRHASVVMVYMPLAREVDLTPVAMRCFQMGKNVCVPRVDWKRKDMTAVEATSFDDHVMDTDEHGLRTPRQGAPIPIASIDLVVVPGLAFDADGHRLGRGGGFYDRFLKRVRSMTRTAALAFDNQIVETVPVNADDVNIELIVTDRRVLRAKTARRQTS